MAILKKIKQKRISSLGAVFLSGLLLFLVYLYSNYQESKRNHYVVAQVTKIDNNVRFQYFFKSIPYSFTLKKYSVSSYDIRLGAMYLLKIDSLDPDNGKIYFRKQVSDTVLGWTKYSWNHYPKNFIIERN